MFETVKGLGMSKWFIVAFLFAWMLLPVAAAEPTADDYLITAVAQGNADAVARHLDDPDTVSRELNPECPPGTRCKPITYAAEQSDPTILRMLLEAGADPNGTNSVGDNGLIMAIMSGNTRGVDMLLAFGADVNQANRFGISALIGATMMGDSVLLEKLLSNGGDPNTRAQPSGGDANQSVAGRPLLCIAAEGGYVDAVGVLIRQGAALDAPSGVGETTADCIEATGSTEMLSLLGKTPGNH
ncbi:hypothetical protein WH87_09565 [Devosia epidermidihirudinis]|uniref:Uncharacterized protein n=1 Tax=Devosia epidermidihirudinis TaxID=1293439 RepID=A0A0F5QD24_9HYPH|nr:ankyrin repeat domain-containing protein [Devosia epidermidihirudinis]KKC37904.1 hypothetical protein WH87_09565 [Devosia epidermidihirudinis]